MSRNRLRRASLSSRSKDHILASPGIKFPVDTMSIPRRASQVIMSSSQKPGKEVATSSHKKRAQSGNVPLAPAIPKGQTRWFEVKVVTKEGKAWYKRHTKASYFSDVCIDKDSLAHEFPQILRQIRELGMEFIFAEPAECNLHMVREFYANWAPEARSHYVTVRDRNVPITPTGINDILGTLKDTNSLMLTSPWHNRLSIAGKDITNLFPMLTCFGRHGLHYTNITRDIVCLVYALMTGTELNIRAIVKSAMHKARVHKGHRYAFGGLITQICRDAGVPEENVDYMTPLYPALVDITQTKGPHTEFGPTLTTGECRRRDELIMARMYGLEMLRH
ncbi:hypothetical protein H5410_052162 [Solanum commersonii]|uniref:Putative plant transposon protein domain-containing protein n=1 Tax=Solanum commersonii TaxID=4109 RepID=A0A9J5X1G5_SOLCO|nr:hypothetical protein H5410_052162 [Solanum commersonii]